MKKLLLLASCLAASAANAADVNLGRLPASDYADTEVSTNLPFAFACQGVNNFEFDLCLAGTPSNSVQLAFGRDADADGVLSADETDMAVGWDCGEWRIACFTNGEVLASAPTTTNLVKDFKWSLRIRRGRPRRLDLAENGEPVFAERAGASEPWFYDPSWDLLRLTVRGVDAAQESARVSLGIAGFAIGVR